MKKKLVELFTDAGVFIFGGACYAVAIDYFTAPNNIAPAGMTGLATVANFLLGSPIGITVILLNLPAVILGFRFLGMRFMLKTSFATVIYSLLIDLGAQFLPKYDGDRLLAAVYGGFISGFALALAFWRGGSTGGTDIIASLVFKYKPHLSMGRLILILDFVTIVIAAAVYRDVDSALYSLIVAFISTEVINRVLYGAGSGKLLYIISSRYDVIAGKILSELGRGVTLLKSEGGYTSQERRVIMCALRKSELQPVNRIIRETDEKAFSIVCEAGEIFGLGFNSLGGG